MLRTAVYPGPLCLRGRYIALSTRTEQCDPNLGRPHTEAFGDGLYELRMKGAEGIARVFFCTLVSIDTSAAFSKFSMRG